MRITSSEYYWCFKILSIVDIINSIDHENNAVLRLMQGG